MTASAASALAGSNTLLLVGNGVPVLLAGIVHNLITESRCNIIKQFHNYRNT
jgi:hypothetical protein